MTLSEVCNVVLMLKQNIEENAALKDEIRSLKEAFASVAARMEACLVKRCRDDQGGVG